MPQGTVLGPILFIIMMNDINTNISSKISSFADDTRISMQIKNQTDVASLQNNLNQIYEWSNTNNLSLNGDKFIHIHHSIPAVSVNPTYKDPNGDEIEVLPNVKDLGLMMSSDCYFEEHIENLCQNCSKISS